MHLCVGGWDLHSPRPVPWPAAARKLHALAKRTSGWLGLPTARSCVEVILLMCVGVLGGRTTSDEICTALGPLLPGSSGTVAACLGRARLALLLCL